MRRLAVLAAILLAAGLPLPAAGQDLASRVRRAGEGWASFRYPVREGVEVCEHGVRFGPDSSGWWGHWHSGEPQRCSLGEAVVALRTSGGEVVEVELEPAAPGAARGRDLGPVDGEEAAAFLLSLARGGATADAAEEALPAAALARGAEAWRGMLDIARDQEMASDLREAALFWVAQSAAAAVARELTDIAVSAGEEQGVKDAAVFALSRRPTDEAVPALMEVARTAAELETRRSAMFWLARLDDPRVVPFFESILAGRPPRR